MNVSELRAKLSELKKQVESTEKDLKTAETTCKHTWNEPELTAGRTSESTLIKLMMSDAFWVQSSNPTWTRTCKTCGRVERTSRSSAKVVYEPIF